LAYLAASGRRECSCCHRHNLCNRGLGLTVSFGDFRHEDEANEKRKKRFAREHDIEESRARGITPVVKGMGDMSVVARRGGNKKFGSLGYAVEEPEPMFDPVSIDPEERIVFDRSPAFD
jgi:hypothetical protein